MGHSTLLWSFIGALVGSVITAIILPVTINFTIDHLLKMLISSSTVKSPLLSNIYHYYNISFKLWLGMGRRAQTGRALMVLADGRPDNDFLADIFFNPAGLTLTRVQKHQNVRTEITLGCHSSSPLNLSLPIIIAAPSSGLIISEYARTVLIQAANRTGTALLGGGQPFTPTEVNKLNKFIYTWPETNEDKTMLSQAAMIEIRVSPNAPPPGDFPTIDAPAGTPEISLINDKKALTRILAHLKKLSGGRPVAARLAAGTSLDKDMRILLSAGIDAIILESHYESSLVAPEILASHFNLPLLPALARANEIIRHYHMENKIDLMVSGGLWTSADFLKAIALGAKAIIISSPVLMAMVQSQLSKALPWSPLESLLLEEGKKAKKLDIETATLNVVNYLEASRQEMSLAIAAMGKGDIAQLDPSDLLTLNKTISEATGISRPY